jgi:alkylation response protein AidB-like acyl-CoA dehydrogenase
MEFGFTEKENNLRKELREFIAKELPPGWIGDGGVNEEYGTDAGWEAAKKMAKKLAAKKWLTIAWPKEYGGLGASNMEHVVYREETAYYMVPGIDMGVGGVNWIGPALMMFGSEEQKKRHLPKIASGDTFWCTAYSEPEVGSDMAAMKCRAVRKGDEYIINGQKVWISAGHRADWCWLAVRTDPDVPKHRGITLLLADMKTPGITVKPLLNMADSYANSEVFFDDAHIPVENRIGEENQGWRYIMTALDFERTAGIDLTARAHRMADELVKYCQQTKRDGRPLSEDPIIRNKLAELLIECEIGRLMCYRIAWMIDRKQVPNYEASTAKTLGAELGQKVSNLGLGIMGLYGQMEHGALAPIKGLLHEAYLYTRGDTIAGGTSEINRGVIAMRGLGLPRG